MVIYYSAEWLMLPYNLYQCSAYGLQKYIPQTRQSISCSEFPNGTAFYNQVRSVEMVLYCIRADPRRTSSVGRVLDFRVEEVMGWIPKAEPIYPGSEIQWYWVCFANDKTLVLLGRARKVVFPPRWKT